MKRLERNLTNCEICERANDCIHKGAFRRLPRSEGGLGLCKNLKIEKEIKTIPKKYEFQKHNFKVSD